MCPALRATARKGGACMPDTEGSSEAQRLLDKGKPAVRRGRKARGLPGGSPAAERTPSSAHQAPPPTARPHRRDARPRRPGVCRRRPRRPASSTSPAPPSRTSTSTPRTPAPGDQAFMRDRFWRMRTYAPYFDSRLAWYRNAWTYKDLYAIYEGESLANEHPEWILHDARRPQALHPLRLRGRHLPPVRRGLRQPRLPRPLDRRDHGAGPELQGRLRGRREPRDPRSATARATP